MKKNYFNHYHYYYYLYSYSWCIDPFGVSSTMPYILNRMKFSSLVIQRTHYSIKKYLAKQKQLEFRWRQHWGTNTLIH